MSILQYLKENLVSEAVTPRLPKGIKYGSRMINSGTMMAFKDTTAKFTTSKGNVVTVHIFPNGDEHEISFDVNNTRTEEDREHDPDILSGVLGVILKMVDKYNLSKLRIKADSDAGDTKYIKNLPMLNYESEFIDIVQKIINELKTIDLTGTPPSPAIEKLHAKRGTVYDPNVHVKSMIKNLTSWIDNIDKDHIATVIKDTKHYLTQDKLFPKQYLDDFERISSEYTKRKLSNVLDTGFAETRNRRYEVYKRLIPKLFKGWDIDMDDRYHVIILHKNEQD